MNAFDTKAKRAAYLGALKALDNGPREIEQATAQYDSDISNVRQMESKGVWAPVAIERMKTQAKNKRDTAIRKAVDRMKPALDTVKAHKNGSGEVLDINDSKIQNTIRTVGAMGRDLSYDAQISIIESFRGDAPALAFVSDLFKRNHLFAADYAKSLTKEVSDQAVEDMESAIAYYDFGSGFDMSKIYWSRGEFAQALERNTVDPGKDPYVAAMVEMKHMARDDANAQQLFGSALSHISEEEAKGNDVDTAAVLNMALAALGADD